MKTLFHRTRLAGSSSLALALGGALPLGAQTHAPYAPFSVIVDPQSTIFNQSIGFNGSRTDLAGNFGVTGVAGQGGSLSGSLSATFKADPGYHFKAVSLSFGPWSYSNSVSYGGYNVSGDWTVPGSTYLGDANPIETSGAVQSGWYGAGDSGGFRHADYNWWTGGGGEALSIMGPWNVFPITLDGVDAFTLNFNSGIWVGDTSGFGASSLMVSVDVAPIPEPSTYALFGVGLLGVGWALRRASSGRQGRQAGP